jgi:hypothetical protein
VSEFQGKAWRGGEEIPVDAPTPDYPTLADMMGDEPTMLMFGEVVHGYDPDELEERLRRFVKLGGQFTYSETCQKRVSVIGPIVVSY